MATELGAAAQSKRDERFMALALSLAERQLGQTAPNPAVGCVIVQDMDGQACVIARGVTGGGGRPHAEAIALDRAGARARGATAYVSLEPCAHHGATPPCAEALIAAGIQRAVIAVQDPDKRVSGRGIAKLRKAGVTVECNVMAAEARALNAGFFLKTQAGRPLITCKTATSLDGRIATHTGQSRWITGEAARQFGHRLRATHDAVMVGSMTAIADDPDLSCRLPGLADRSPVRIVADGRLRLPLTAGLVRDARQKPTWVLTRHDAEPARMKVLTECGVTVIPVRAGEAGSLDMAEALAALGARGLTRVLVEGGAALMGALVRARLADRVAWFHANTVVGGDGLAALPALGIDALTDCPRWALTGGMTLGADRVDFYSVTA